jgi:hypothetical protein
MRIKSLLTALVAAVALMLATPDVSHAGGDGHKPHGWNKSRHIKHWVYYPRYIHHYKVDPYAYRYSPRGYYPYYGTSYYAPSGYVKWRKRKHLNAWNGRAPRYYKSWGYPRKWHNRKWHRKHHGYHHRWHW